MCNGQTLDGFCLAILWLPCAMTFLFAHIVHLLWKGIVSQWWSDRALVGVVLVEGEGILVDMSLRRVCLWDWICSQHTLCGKRTQLCWPRKIHAVSWRLCWLVYCSSFHSTNLQQLLCCPHAPRSVASFCECLWGTWPSIQRQWPLPI